MNDAQLAGDTERWRLLEKLWDFFGFPGSGRP